NKSTILQLYNKYKEIKSTKDLPKSGRSHILTNWKNCRALEVSPTTIQRVFKDNGFKSAVKAKKPLLLSRHKKR
ncbi:9235_t:CDS:2, partial [Funneliformis geosporum]